MSQQSDNLHVTKDGESVIVPCLCGTKDDFVTFQHVPDSTHKEFGYFSVHLAPAIGWRHRIAAAWHTFWNARSYSETLLNYEAATTLRDWLTEKLK